jgi:outer membrane protein assembly factor BamD (BamD/ComL family)
MDKDKQQNTIGISSRIYEKFLVKLKEDGASDEAIEQLKKIQSEGSLSEANLKKALFPEVSEL